MRWNFFFKFMIPCIMIQLLNVEEKFQKLLQNKNYVLIPKRLAFLEKLLLHICASVNPCFFTTRKIFSVHLSYCIFGLDSSDITFYRDRTRLTVWYFGEFRRYNVCQTNLPLNITSKIERSTLLNLPEFFNHQICYTHTLHLQGTDFTAQQYKCLEKNSLYVVSTWQSCSVETPCFIQSPGFVAVN